MVCEVQKAQTLPPLTHAELGIVGGLVSSVPTFLFLRFTTGAPPHLALMHYPELADNKGIVLVRGDVINDNVIDTLEVKRCFEVPACLAAATARMKLMGVLQRWSIGLP